MWITKLKWRLDQNKILGQSLWTRYLIIARDLISREFAVRWYYKKHNFEPFWWWIILGKHKEYALAMGILQSCTKPAIFAFSIISLDWDDTGIWNPSSGNQGLIYLIYPILWLLVTCGRKEPDHQQSLYWPVSWNIPPLVSGPLFNERTDVSAQDLVKSRSREIGVYTFPIAPTMVLWYYVYHSKKCQIRILFVFIC